MATNLFNSISEAWAADATLNGLLSSEKISQTRAEDPELPFVIVEQVDDQRSGRSSKGDEWTEQIQISVFVENISVARRVQKEYRRVLDAPFKPTLDDGIAIDWQRQRGGRTVEEGAIGSAKDVYFLIKRTTR